ncbi:PREDICTED: uncharacterized protein LOC105449176 [Wasmannia auropunctata]|uniref:uncharacterized protein LOC105449176 n=1 Tax=Wasmannia auropunctata TaxID=64793 RepID=UPI0005EE1E8F|nr:PREDICTED: uncharacterized protein LOC105449176 [Wasmannia auropunctata]
MFRSIALFAVVVLFQAAIAVDVSKPEIQELKYISKGVVPIAALRNFLRGSTHSNGFIGDLELGKLTVNDTMAHFFNYHYGNNSPHLQTWRLARVTFSDKIVTYVVVRNNENSYGAVCGEASDIGSNQSPRFWVRIAPYSNVTLTQYIFARYEKIH